VTGISWIVGPDGIWILIMSTIVLDSRLQPPVPINKVLNELLDEVNDTGDSWLLFL